MFDFIDAFLIGVATIRLVMIQRTAQRLENAALCRLDQYNEINKCERYRKGFATHD